MIFHDQVTPSDTIEAQLAAGGLIDIQIVLEYEAACISLSKDQALQLGKYLISISEH